MTAHFRCARDCKELMRRMSPAFSQTESEIAKKNDAKPKRIGKGHAENLTLMTCLVSKGSPLKCDDMPCVMLLACLHKK